MKRKIDVPERNMKTSHANGSLSIPSGTSTKATADKSIPPPKAMEECRTSSLITSGPKRSKNHEIRPPINTVIPEKKEYRTISKLLLIMPTAKVICPLYCKTQVSAVHTDVGRHYLGFWLMRSGANELLCTPISHFLPAALSWSRNIN